MIIWLVGLTTFIIGFIVGFVLVCLAMVKEVHDLESQKEVFHNLCEEMKSRDRGKTE